MLDALKEEIKEEPPLDYTSDLSEYSDVLMVDGEDTKKEEEHKEEIRNLIESKIGKKLDIDVRQVEEGRRFEDSFVDIEKLINMDIVVEDV